MHCAEMYTWCFGPYASLRGFGNGGPNPRYLLTLFLVLNGLGAEHVIRWYLRRGFLNERKDANHVQSIFEALKTDQFHRQHKSYKKLLVSSNYEQMSKPACGDAWVLAPIPETSDDVGYIPTSELVCTGALDALVLSTDHSPEASVARRHWKRTKSLLSELSSATADCCDAYVAAELRRSGHRVAEARSWRGVV